MPRSSARATCLIFDLDGTLVDSEPLASRAFLDLLPDLDDTVSSHMHRYRGQRMADVLANQSRRLGRPLDEAFVERYNEHLSILYDKHLAPMPGVAAALGRLGHHPRCVASNGERSKIQHALRAAGLAEGFGPNLFSAYDIGHWKPEPHLFLHAASVMGFDPSDCVVIEDSDVGVAAGHAAGMRVIRYRPGDALINAPGEALLSEFEDLPALLGAFGSLD